MSNSQKTFVLLDFDGTLVQFGWQEAAVQPLRQRLVALAEQRGVRAPHGLLFPALLQAGRDDVELMQALDACEQAAAQRARPCIGAQELLAWLLEQRHLACALVTNNGQISVSQALRAAGLVDFALPIICRDDVHETKPHPEGLHLAIAQLTARSGAPAAVAVVGDAVTDLQAAAALRRELSCPVRAFAVAGGVSSAQALAAAGADRVLSSLQELASYLSCA